MKPISPYRTSARETETPSPQTFRFEFPLSIFIGIVSGALMIVEEPILTLLGCIILLLWIMLVFAISRHARRTL